MTDEHDTVLVIAAHPDDEVLGCGASLARHAHAGDSVQVAILSDGVGARGERDGAADRRRDAAARASRLLGCQPPRHFDFPDNALDTVPLIDIVRTVEELMAELRPNVLYVHHGGDLNVDHRIAHEAAMTAARPLPGSSVRAIYAFEVLSSTGWRGSSAGEAFLPTRYIDITGFLAPKLGALEVYAEEMRSFPHARSTRAVEALHTYRGAMVGLSAAEAFVVEREIVGVAANGDD